MRRHCYWCGNDANGTALAALYDEFGRYLTRLGGRFASCGEHGIGYTPTRVIPPEVSQP